MPPKKRACNANAKFDYYLLEKGFSHMNKSVYMYIFIKTSFPNVITISTSISFYWRLTRFGKELFISISITPEHPRCSLWKYNFLIPSQTSGRQHWCNRKSKKCHHLRRWCLHLHFQPGRVPTSFDSRLSQFKYMLCWVLRIARIYDMILAQYQDHDLKMRTPGGGATVRFFSEVAVSLHIYWFKYYLIRCQKIKPQSPPHRCSHFTPIFVYAKFLISTGCRCRNQ